MTKKGIIKALYITLRHLSEIQEVLDLTTKDDDNMALDKTVTDLLAAIDTATTSIADRIARLVAQAAAAGALTPEAQAAFQVEVDKLNALGKDPVVLGVKP